MAGRGPVAGRSQSVRTATSRCQSSASWWRRPDRRTPTDLFQDELKAKLKTYVQEPPGHGDREGRSTPPGCSSPARWPIRAPIPLRGRGLGAASDRAGGRPLRLRQRRDGIVVIRAREKGSGIPVRYSDLVDRRGPGRRTFRSSPATPSSCPDRRPGRGPATRHPPSGPDAGVPMGAPRGGHGSCSGCCRRRRAPRPCSCASRRAAVRRRWSPSSGSPSRSGTTTTCCSPQGRRPGRVPHQGHAPASG